MDKQEIEELGRRVDIGLEKLLEDNGQGHDMNMVKAVKNDIFQKASRIFIYNLKKLIQLEGTQKKLAKKIGISEDLLSKYKSGEAFPSIETLLFIAECYHMDLHQFISAPFSIGDIEAMIVRREVDFQIFEKHYYAYFFVTNKSKEHNIHEGVIEIAGDGASFRILSDGNVVKSFKGHCRIAEKLVFFEFQNARDGNAYINMIKPNVNIDRYAGGLGLFMLPSDANSKPCMQKIILSRKCIDRDAHYEKLKELLDFRCENEIFGNMKISQTDDERAYDFIMQL